MDRIPTRITDAAEYVIARAKHHDISLVDTLKASRSMLGLTNEYVPGPLVPVSNAVGASCMAGALANLDESEILIAEIERLYH